MRRSWLLGSLWLLSACSADPAAPLTAVSTPLPEIRVVSDAIIDLSIASEALGRQANVRVVLPAGYDRSAARTYPVLYLLHGAREPLGYSAWSEQSRVASLVRDHALLVVMPEGGDAGWYSNWRAPCKPDDGRAPAWEDFHTQELPRVLREHFHAAARSAIAGLSMGGFGALSYAARHPGQYAAAAAYSGALHVQAFPEIVQAALSIAGCAQGDEVWGDPQRDAEVWAAHDPYALAERLLDLPTYIASGDGEPGPLDAVGATRDGLEALALQATRDLDARLHDLGAMQCTTSYYGAGTHSWPYWDRELGRSLPMLLSALGVP